MRHADIRTTMNTYGDVVTGQESEALSRIAAMTFDKQLTRRTENKDMLGWEMGIENPSKPRFNNIERDGLHVY